ncbi:2-oxoglutarate dehydrogenase E1 component [Brucella ovis IntaBari-2006-46-332]|uniref:2-oxoglutarate dehydrogenase E1 component n=1 Tax=Brucella ovis (strain ATCC 25840 / 63/290 / NCTC 10512) TaxID=444178 RepID=ODO1_BRUO2|nr:2-oxoglutarate dehydrogenase E1 component [Brucella ovis]A5VSQ0.1 RecName: Full=2-oxoglutarate dehydrogenase E1 component; AltName: Full=Alpha-ketoglutarate dehydrogenase [Brucella ovis ATCC 25840]ABQ60359.1 oxoglutarate dehydrogenase (succinyl-transferring), E1 component [Brucella ovis ATCC 25840]ENR02598.1 2-oxoglutarate dehydrogenase E1 component [Brucella ovis 80/125]ENR07456.1 2-oxoglutarate dehydrogenase E1 component [Brucella ovis F8/05B]ENS97218.1 2-oxoglutarate dehydrogenase E1 com
MAKQEQAPGRANDVFALTSFLYGGNADYIEELYAKYEDDPNSVDPQWRDFFAKLGDNADDVKKNAEGPSWTRKNWPIAANGELVSALDGNWAEVEKHVTDKLKGKAAKGEAKGAAGTPLTAEEITQAARDSVRAIMMIRAYRMRGHLHANLDPLGLAEKPNDYNELEPENYGFTPADYNRKIFIDNVLGLEYATVPEMLDILKRTYCGAIGVEFMHISDPAEKAWIQERIEGPDKKVAFTPEGKMAILSKLIEAEGFEQFIDVKYKGTKRFGLDGGESLIPALEQIVKRGGQMGLKEVVLGMAHRGRLNVLSQVMGKPHRAIFHEFKGGSYTPDDVEGSGDVKYHLGASSDREFDGNKVHLSLTANPSHLEIVNPVVMGKARAKQDLLVGRTRDDMVPLSERAKVLPLLLHGDAAFAGQGVVAECLGLSGLKGHRVAGTLHFIINNQIGFTTNPAFSRSSPYPSDVAKMIEAPIFHVNGDDPEAVVFAAKVATEFRMTFHKPVVIDMFCYRRFGHNEGDEPSFTQPLMYKAIRAHKTTVQLYGEKLIAEGLVTQDDIDRMKADWRQKLEGEFEAGQSYKPNKADWLDGAWAGLRTADNADEQRCGKTAVPVKTLKEIGKKLVEVPKDFHVHRTIQRFLDNRAKMMETGEGIDWATAESLAFGSLAVEGHPIRLSGQDVERGTFSQRHTVLYDQENQNRYIPLNNLQKGQAIYEAINSMLSEEAVLGYEYGYSLSDPRALVLWEAQFGDFANGAQVVFDQFISSGERKWLRMSGLVCLLPHGFEGQGPEHSSARLERYLQLCAEDNMQVANVTTPANYFHILRRQMKRDFRKPLIMMTPKSLLRHKRAISTLAELSGESSFHRLLWDDAQYNKDEGIKLQKDAKIRRVVLCSGKVYYDLYEEREKRGIDDVYLLRVEQLYPFPAKALINELSRFRHAEMVWCQEEPKNMGAWSFIDPYLEWVLAHIDAKHQRVRYAGRPAAASPATGLMSKHLAQLAAFLEDALG